MLEPNIELCIVALDTFTLLYIKVDSTIESEIIQFSPTDTYGPIVESLTITFFPIKTG